MIKKLTDVYEVYETESGEDYMVDVFHFASKKEAQEFEKDIVGNYKVRQITKPTVELVECLFDQISELYEQLNEAEDKLKIATLFINNIQGMQQAKTKGPAKVYPFSKR